MKTESASTPAGAAGEKPSGNWFDPIETEFCAKVCGFIETMIEGELEMAPARPAAAASLEEAGGKLFTFTRVPESQWKPLRTANAIARLHEAFKRRIKTHTVLPGAESAAMLFWALMASGQIAMRKAGGWQSLSQKPSGQALDPAA